MTSPQRIPDHDDSDTDRRRRRRARREALDPKRKFLGSATRGWFGKTSAPIISLDICAPSNASEPVAGSDTSNAARRRSP